MGLYNFKARFAAPIRTGKKLHTIRAPRANGREDKPGYMMYLYTGLRTVKAERILPDPPVCIKVESIVVNLHATGCLVVWIGPFLDHVRQDRNWQLMVIGSPEDFGLCRLDDEEMELFAQADGFESWQDMASFWSASPSFYGHIFHWHPAQKLK